MTRWKTPWSTLVRENLISSSFQGVYIFSTSVADPNVALVVDEFAGKEGLPAGMDAEVNNVVNDEINKL